MNPLEILPSKARLQFFSAYTVTDVLGKGAEGSVYLAREKSSAEKYAVKHIVLKKRAY